MATKIRVDNLSCDITEDNLMDVFSQVGAVESVKIQTDLLTWHSKCSGYVEMSLDVDAYRAVHCFNGATFNDKRIHITEDKPLYERARDVVLQQVHAIAQQAEDIKREYAKKFH
jgi:RNA recognition motif-containing protein